MLVKLLRPLLENGLNCAKLISTANLSTSGVLFQQPFSGTNIGASSKPTNAVPNLKNQQEKKGTQRQNRAESENEQERSQQEGPADREAQRKSSNKDEKTKK